MVRQYEPVTVKNDTVMVWWARRQQRRRPSVGICREKYIFVTGYGAVGETPAEGRPSAKKIEERNKKAHHNRCEKNKTRKKILW
jgi:hypothetical protein